MQTSFFDIQWPPPPVDIPYVPYDAAEIGGIVKDSMFVSLRSIGDTGITLFVNLISVAFIVIFFRVLVFDKIKFFGAISRRVLNRNVKAADIQRHRNDIIQERVRDMELSAEGRRKYRSTHLQDNVQDALYRKVVNFASNKQFESQYTKERNSYYKKRLKG